MLESSQTLDLDRLRRIGQVCPLHHLRMATRVITQLYDEILKPLGLRGTQLPVLAATAQLGPVTISHLAQALVMDRTTLTRNIKPLQKQGWLGVTPGSDQRTRQVSLTHQGASLVNQALPLWEVAQARVIDSLGEEWRQELLRDLSPLIALTQERD